MGFALLVESKKLLYLNFALKDLLFEKTTAPPQGNFSALEEPSNPNQTEALPVADAYAQRRWERSIPSIFARIFAYAGSTETFFSPAAPEALPTRFSF